MKALVRSIGVGGAMLALSCAVIAAEGRHWGYSGHGGPGEWGAMSGEFATCSLGKEQSPIDIADKDTVRAALGPIRFDYKPSPLMIVDNGHTVQVNYAPGSSITVNGTRYELLQFHFHRPSEERIDGKAHAMVVHLVHKDAQGKLAVVGVLVDAGSGNAALKQLWRHLPKKKGKELRPRGVTIDANALLPADRSYYTFAGSLTTPPCSEGVTWFVLKTPVSATAAQIETFARIYPDNARPVQPRNGRVIRASE